MLFFLFARKLKDICLILLLIGFTTTRSAYGAEELTLDVVEPEEILELEFQNETPSAAPATKPSNSDQKGLIAPKNSPPKVSQSETTKKTGSNYSKLFSEKKYSELTQLMWTNIENLNDAELTLLIKAHYLNQDYFEAIRAANLALAKNESSYEALTYLGLCHLKRKKEREAKDYFRRATDINPTYPPAVNGLVEIYEKNGNFYELRLIYQDLIKKNGERSEYLNKLCDIDTRDGITDSALTNCKRAITLSPQTPENYSNLGVVYKNINDIEKGRAQLKMAAEKFPKSDLTQLNYAAFLEDQKNYVDSFKYYSRCVKVNTLSEKCWVGYTTTSYQLQKFSETLAGLKKSCQFNKKHLFVGRKAASFARSVKQADWAKKIDTMAEICGN